MKIALIGSSGKDSLESNMLEAYNQIENVVVDLVQWPPRIELSYFPVLSRAINYFFRNSKVNWIFLPIFFRKIRTLTPDLIIVFTGAARILSPKSTAEIKLSTKAVFCWYVDASINLTENILFSKYDKMYFIDKGLLDYLSPILRSTNSSLLLEGYNREHHRALPSIKRNNKIAVVGSLYPERILLLEYLVGLGFELEIYGFGLPRGYGNGPLREYDRQKFLTLEGKSAVFQEARCVINTFTPSHKNAINCRIFEAMASGALVVSQSSELLKETFQQSKDLLMYETFEELGILLDQLFDDNYDEEEIRRQAIIAVANHSLHARAQVILEDYNILITP